MPACRIKRMLLWIFVLAILLCAAVGASPKLPRQPVRQCGREVAEPTTEPGELEPVAVPEPSELAMQFYRSGNWLWMLNVAWAMLVPGVLAFSGFSARLRNLAARLGR